MRPWFALACCGLVFATTALAAGPGDEVVVIYNSRSADSKSVAMHYAQRRVVPARQVVGLPLPMTETMTRLEYRQQLEEPLLDFLRREKLFVYATKEVGSDSPPAPPVSATVRYAVLCFDVPLKTTPDRGLREPEAEKLQPELRRNEAAVDDELALLPIAHGPRLLAGPTLNRLYATTNAADIHPTNGVLMVTRLDGPSAGIARALVDKALEAETNGLWGRAYFDLRGLKEGPFKLGDDILRGASEIVRQQGFTTVVDEQEALFGTGFPMSQIGLYAGWYTEHVQGPFAQREVEFMPGAFAYHLHSFSAATLRSTTRHWCGPFLGRGVTVTLGSVHEPFLAGTPDIATLLHRWMALGFTYGEAAIAARQTLSWQTAVIGDPLYRPFGVSAKDRHEDLERRGAGEIEWSHLRLVNAALGGGMTAALVLSHLERVPLAQRSTVLSEQLAELYAASGKPASAIRSLQTALELQPTPLQRLRLLRALADQLAAGERFDEAIAAGERLLKEVVPHPESASLYQSMAAWAEKAGKDKEAARYREAAQRARR